MSFLGNLFHFLYHLRFAKVIMNTFTHSQFCKHFSNHFSTTDDSPFEEDPFDIPDTPSVNITWSYLDMKCIKIFQKQKFIGSLLLLFHFQDFDIESEEEEEEIGEEESRDLSMWKITIPHVIMETRQVQYSPTT